LISSPYHPTFVKLSIIIAMFSCFVFQTYASEVNNSKLNTITSHGFSLYGDLKYPANFEHFDFVNPDAPKGGTLNLMGFSSYDSLNPYTLKGASPFNTPGQFIYGFTELNESLLVGTGDYLPSGDEPQSAYGLLAENLSYPEDYKWVHFKIRKQAHFHDGHQIDADDVAYSFELLMSKGHPRFQQTLFGVESVKAISKSVVHVEFKQANQAANILRIGEMPVLPKHYWEAKDFERSTQVVPLLSGPYEVSDFQMGHSMKLKRKADFWAGNIDGRTLNIYRGRFNFDLVNIDFYRDQAVAFEAFKAGDFDLFYDYTAKNWAMGYDFPALTEGKVIKAEISHKIPSTTQAFFFNTRRNIFKDKRVRQALSLMFDFEWTNKALFNNAYHRNQSYFPNSDFAATALPSKQELLLLEPFKNTLPSALFSQTFTQAVTQGNGNIRKQMKQALSLLKQAGWSMVNNQMTQTDTGKVFEFEILIRQAGIQRVLLPFIKNLERIGSKQPHA